MVTRIKFNIIINKGSLGVFHFIRVLITSQFTLNLKNISISPKYIYISYQVYNLKNPK